ncbi:hypothetical protein [Halorubrum sp. 48-1-W]|uniref:hypothetical protein n=1 Tax=Halorubrum sp. 48-1-W TaxID=2249761 RepID=UPI0018E55777|nr:hypothetical protein [Halorubrum sp. 48-1-W]
MNETTTDDGGSIPALNELTVRALDEEPEYAGGERMYAILFEEDYDGHAVDVEGNVALLVNCEQAAEIRELMGEIMEELGGESA